MKKIVFMTGTRADFGKLKSLMFAVEKSEEFALHVFVTGMHMNSKYGKTIVEIDNCGFKNLFPFYNHVDYYAMDSILSKTVEGFSAYIRDEQPDLIVLHGDRVETLAGAIVGALNGVTVAHIEGGELSGTIDESLRHAVSKLSHIHLVSNNNAKNRLIQMGESPDSIFVIGSPDIDLMKSPELPSLTVVKKWYDIKFEGYGILIFHPVTTEFANTRMQAKQLVDAILESGKNFVVIFPNNDHGSDFILDEYKRFNGVKSIKAFSSLRFEYFLTLLQSSKCIVGNSSCGVMEAPFYGTPTVNIGTRQNNRSKNENILHTGYMKNEIGDAITIAWNNRVPRAFEFGKGDSADRFLGLLESGKLWKIAKQKIFNDL